MSEVTLRNEVKDFLEHLAMERQLSKNTVKAYKRDLGQLDIFLTEICLLPPKESALNLKCYQGRANIDEVCITLKPRSLASGGTKTKTNDWSI